MFCKKNADVSKNQHFVSKNQQNVVSDGALSKKLIKSEPKVLRRWLNPHMKAKTWLYMLNYICEPSY